MAKKYTKSTKKEWEMQFGGILQKLAMGGDLNQANIISRLSEEMKAQGMVAPKNLKKFDLGGMLTKYVLGGETTVSPQPAFPEIYDDETMEIIRKSLAKDLNTNKIPDYLERDVVENLSETTKPLPFLDSFAAQRKNIKPLELPQKIVPPPVKEGLLSTVNKAMPYAQAIGQIADFGISSLKENAYEQDPMQKDYNPYTMKLGGMLKKYTDGGTMPGSKTFMGPTHEEGGIPVDQEGQVNSNNAIAEVENDEFMHKFSFIPRKGNYIYSKALGTADMAEQLVDKYTKKKSKHGNPLTDNLAKQQMEFELKQIADINDMRKAMEASLKMAEAQTDAGMAEGQMRLGGILGKVLKQYSLGGPMSNTPKTMTDAQLRALEQDRIDSTTKFELKDSDFKLNIPLYYNPTVGTSQDQRSVAQQEMDIRGGLGMQKYPRPIYDMETGENIDKLTSLESDVLKGLGPFAEKDDEDKKNKKDKTSRTNLTTSPVRINTADSLRAAVMLGDTFQALRPALKESPILPDYGKARGELDSMTVDLTQAKNAAVSTFNEASEQIKNTSPSIQSYVTRKMGMASSQAEALSQIASKEREMRNAIAQAKGGFEQAVATDIANRRYQNRIDNLQNKAAKEAYIQRLGDNMLGIAKDLDARRVAELKTVEGNDFLKLASQYYEAHVDKDTGRVTYAWKKKEG